MISDKEYDEIYSAYNKLTKENIIGATPVDKGVSVAHSYKNHNFITFI
jgi:hypothetical protein